MCTSRHPRSMIARGSNAVVREVPPNVGNWHNAEAAPTRSKWRFRYQSGPCQLCLRRGGRLSTRLLGRVRFEGVLKKARNSSAPPLRSPVLRSPLSCPDNFGKRAGKSKTKASPISSRHRTTGAFNLCQSGERFGCHCGRRVLAEQWRILAPGLSRSFVELTTDKRENSWSVYAP